jgi:hypothetical protein
MRMPTLKKRIDIIWIAVALVAAGAGGFALATASSSASDDNGTPAGTLQLAAAGDPALASTDPGDSDDVAKLVYATGVAASDTAAAPQTWRVGDRSVLGYTAADGRFCFEFRSLGGGCLQPGVLTDELPVDLTTDYGPGTFHAYGLALDGVTAVSVSVGGTSRPAAFAHNSFYFSDDALGGTAGITGQVVATMSDGTTRTLPFKVGSMEDMLAPQ